MHTANRTCDTHKYARLLRPEKAPLAMDVIRLLVSSLQRLCESSDNDAHHHTPSTSTFELAVSPRRAPQDPLKQI
jgi:hypothetical protein